MTTTVTFQTSTAAAAVARAARVAPTKGPAHDRAAGILFEIRPGTDTPVIIKSTNIEVTYLEVVDTIDVQGDPADWRIPSGLLSGFLSALPVDGTVTFKPAKTTGIEVKSGKTKARFATIETDTFPKFQQYDASPLVEVPDFATRVAQVSWACDKATIPFTGIRVGPDSLIATDRYKLVRVPCKVDVLTDPIVVPLDVLAPILKNVAHARLAVGNRRLRMMPDPHSQISSTIIDAVYPPVEKAMTKDYPHSLPLSAERVTNVLNRMLLLAKGDRYPIVRLTIGEKKIAVYMFGEEIGEMEDEIDVLGADHPPHVCYFTPANLLDAFSHAGKDEVTFSYDNTKEYRNVMIEDGDGYECWVVPRRNTKTDPDGGSATPAATTGATP